MGDFANWNNTPNQPPRREKTLYTKDRERKRWARIVIGILWVVATIVASWMTYIWIKNEFSEAYGSQLYQQQDRPGQRLERSRPIGDSANGVY